MARKKRVVQVARETSEQPPDAAFSVLLVCTGNICRSPAAEALFAQKLAAEKDLPISSAGTEALVGSPIDPRMRELLPQNSAVEDFAARQLTTEMVIDADLVLGMTKDHRSAAVSLHPPALRYSFTLKEFAGILESLQVDRPTPVASSTSEPLRLLAEMVPLAFAQRVHFTSRHADSLNVDDPYGRSTAVFRASFDDISSAVDSISRQLLPH